MSCPPAPRRPLGVYLHRALAILLMHAMLFEFEVASAQDRCSTADLMNAQDIVATCCESGNDDCGTIFPATCAHSCARLVVPYIDSCGTLLEVMPDETFPGIHITGCAAKIDIELRLLMLFEV
eukprot:SAG31_NODE_2168_length_6266_cov_11.946976_3_plen_123_part_00